MTYRLQQLEKILTYEHLLEKAKVTAVNHNTSVSEAGQKENTDWHRKREKINWAIAQRIDTRIKNLIKLL